MGATISSVMRACSPPFEARSRDRLEEIAERKFERIVVRAIDSGRAERLDTRTED